MKRHEICGFCHQFAGGLIGLVSQPLSGKAGSSLGFAEVSSCPNFTFVYARFAPFRGHVHTDERLAHIAPAALQSDESRGIHPPDFGS